MKKNKFLTLVASCGYVLATLTGCGSKPDTGHTIRVWTTFNDDYQAVIKKVITSFEAKYPEYKIENVKQSSDYNGLKSMVTKGVAAGDYPDICAAYPDSVADFIYTTKALDITSLMNSTEEYNGIQIGWTQDEKEDIPQAYLDEGSSFFLPGTYSAPLCKSTEAMFYNKTLLLDIDLSSIDDSINDGEPLDADYFENGLTWEEMFNHLCPALVAYNEGLADDKKIWDPSNDYKDTAALVGYDSDDNLFITLAEQYGLGYTSLNTELLAGKIEFVETDASGNFSGVSNEWRAVTKMFTDAYKNKYFTTKGVVGKNVNYVSTTGNSASDGAGMLFSIGSTGGVKYQFSSERPYDVGVCPIPHAEGKAAKVISQGPSVAFLKRGKTPEIMNTRALGTWLFYKEWVSTAFATEWATATGYSPLRDSVASQPAYLAISNVESKTAKTLDIVKARTFRYVPTVSDALFTSPVFVGSSKARNAVSGIYADIFKGAKDLDTTSQDYYDLVTAKFRAGYENAI